MVLHQTASPIWIDNSSSALPHLASTECVTWSKVSHQAGFRRVAPLSGSWSRQFWICHVLPVGGRPAKFGGYPWPYRRSTTRVRHAWRIEPSHSRSWETGGPDRFPHVL